VRGSPVEVILEREMFGLMGEWIELRCLGPRSYDLNWNFVRGNSRHESPDDKV
jgi:hypothetical protein